MFKKLVKIGMLLCFASCTPAISAQVEKPTPETPVIGNTKAIDAAKMLEEIGDRESAKDIRKALKRTANKNIEFNDLNFEAAAAAPKPFQYTSHAFGYIPTTVAPGTTLIDITDAGNITPDETLRNQFVIIRLDRLRVFDYPGSGIHNVLFNFNTRHQAVGATEELNFSQRYRAQEGQEVGITGNPVFVGLNVGNNGIVLRCETVNVENENDEKILRFLNGSIFTSGLQLLNTVNPIVPVVTEYAKGITELVASRNKNIKVQEFTMGLDFSPVATSAKLKEGSYIVVQHPEGAWNWSQWQFNPSSGQIVSRADNTKTIPLNYIVFSISKMNAVTGVTRP
jgi:hypothetical protein